MAKAFRRQGLGRKMLDHLLMIARQTGTQNVGLEATETWDEVIAFYESYYPANASAFANLMWHV